ncbi:hypothetical protein D0T49_07225 [Paludibacter sp. 221]|uniref:hypothetical protein n=1 Tax=Paludibacter sp. 221 TaxID=2302939 RepID=UPI0013D3D001|nr:hypothetical protein [Paludibacter sp. 221]NDV46837.1 hypothetical protein [Paludibacter sp. 221]
MKKYNSEVNVLYKWCKPAFLTISFLFLFACGNTTPEPEEEDLSMYVTQVYEYVYAPGQHAKDRKKEDAQNFVGKPDTDLYLGGFGGYVVAGFDHDIMNVEGEYDFEVFSAGITPEPAVVYVMSDENGDGEPNGTWYELKGSEFDNKSTIRDYYVVYFKPESDNANVRWKDSMGAEGDLISGHGAKSTAAWWWSETKEDSIKLSGVRLPDAYVNNSPDPQAENWVVPAHLFKWGYAENNRGEDYDKGVKSNRFDISNAIDEKGNSVKLEHIRFIKVQTAVFQQAGWLNEVSSEVRGARDLHYSQDE